MSDKKAEAPKPKMSLNQAIAVLNKNTQTIENALFSRSQMARTLTDPTRDIDQECGYPVDIDDKLYKKYYERGDVASRVVSLYPDECWSADPIVVENEDDDATDFEEDWAAFIKKSNAYHYLHRIDVMSGIGRFGVILLGINDGKPNLSDPVDGIETEDQREANNRKYELLYMRVFAESDVRISTLENNVQSPRYGRPTMYEISIASSPSSEGSEEVKKTVRVHWSRIIHIADNRESSEIYGVPRMQRVFNRLYDIKKVSAGSGEMFWQGAFPGFSLETNPNLTEDIEIDADATKEQMEKWRNGLQRYLVMQNMSVKSLAPQVADPGPHVTTQLKLLCVAMKVPWRIFLGSEEAKLASTSDKEAWNGRLNQRQKRYLTPMVVQPFIDRLMALGVVAEAEDYTITWPDLNTRTEEDIATVADKRTSAAAKYVTAGVEALIPPFHYLTEVLGFEDEQANAILEDATEETRLSEDPDDMDDNSSGEDNSDDD